MTGDEALATEAAYSLNLSGPESNDLPLPSRRVRDLEEQMQTNSKRDFQLWSISILVILVLAAGFVAGAGPGPTSAPASFRSDARHRPELFCGMLVLVLLFSIYVTAQKRELNVTRRTLLQEFLMRSQLQAFSLLDPVTQLLKSCAMDPITSKEIARSNRLGAPLTFATISLDNYPSILKRAPGERGEQALYQAARLLKSNFRGSDAIFRTGTNEFVVVMPDTGEGQAEKAISRLCALTERWNAETDAGFEFSFSWGVAVYVAGANTGDVLERARRCMFLSSQKTNFVFQS